MAVRAGHAGGMSDTRLNAPFLVAALLCFAVPILLVPVPALLDYPNHLARIWLLGGGVEEGVANAHVLTTPEGFLTGWSDESAPYHKLWRERFDYVLLLNADTADKYGSVPLPPELEPVADEGFARLYRIRRAATARTERQPR